MSSPRPDTSSDEEETADTLKASDLTAADLAALASLAKKRSGSQLRTHGQAIDSPVPVSPSGHGAKLCHITPHGHVREVVKVPKSSMTSFEDEDDDDAGWADDFDLQDDLKNLGARSRLLSSGGSRDESASDAPSTMSMSEFTADTSEGRASQQLSDAMKKHTASSRAPSSSVSSVISSANPSTVSKAGDAPLVIGDMLFDAKKLCWVRRDGKEDDDPFGSDFDDGSEDRPESCSSDALSSAQKSNKGEEESASRFMRRVQSDTPLSGAESPSGSQVEASSTMSKALRRISRRWRGAIRRRTSNSSSTFKEAIECGDDDEDDDNNDDREASSSPSQTIQFSELVETIKKACHDDACSDVVPPSLSNCITADLWRASLQAASRHTDEMAGFIPRSNAADSTVRQAIPPIPISSRSSSLPRHGKIAKNQFFGRVSKAPQETTIKEKKQVPLGNRASTTRLYLLREMSKKGKKIS